MDNRKMKINLNIDKAIETIKEKKYKVIALEGPEGLKPKIKDVAEKIEEETGATVITVGEPCRGACDLKNEILPKNVEAIFHFGHKKMLNTIKNVYYLEATIDCPNWTKKIEREIQKLDETKRIVVVTTSPYEELAKKTARYILKRGMKIHTAEKGHPTVINVLGCQVKEIEGVDKETDLYLFIGDGVFHPLGVALNTTKKVYQIGPEAPILRNLSQYRNKILKKRLLIIEKAREKKKFGVILGLKPGQRKLKEAMQIKEKLKKAGYKAVIIALDEINPEKIINFPDLEAIVNTACPRVSIDDQQNFHVPVLTTKEAEYMLKLIRRYKPF